MCCCFGFGSFSLLCCLHVLPRLTEKSPDRAALCCFIWFALFMCLYLLFTCDIYVCVCVWFPFFIYPYFYLKIFVTFKKHHRVRRYRKGSQRLPTMLLFFSCRFLVISFNLQIFLFSEPNWVFILRTVLCYFSFRFNFVSNKH